MKAWTRWQNWVSLVLGVILFITPWVFGTAMNGASSWDAWIIGVIGVILAVVALAFVSAAWIPEYLSVVLGACLFISPFFLCFAGLSSSSLQHWCMLVIFVVINS